MSSDPLLARDLPDLPRTHGIEWGEAYFPSPEDFRAWAAESALATHAPDWLDNVFPASACILTAHIRPEAWVRDNAVEVDPEGDTTWRLIPADLDLRSADLDFLISSANTPQWVRDWGGPFTIDLEIVFPDSLSAHERLALSRALAP